MQITSKSQTAIVLVCFLISVLPVAAQHAIAPKNEFVLRAADSELVVARGTSTSTTVTIIKSKGFEKSGVKLGIGTLPDCLTASFDPDSGNLNESKLTITANNAPTEGTYPVLLNCTIRNKTKAIILKIKIQ